MFLNYAFQIQVLLRYCFLHIRESKSGWAPLVVVGYVDLFTRLECTRNVLPAR